MFKHRYALAAALTGVSILASGISVAAEATISSGQTNPNGIYVIKNQEDFTRLKETLEENGIDCSGLSDIESIQQFLESCGLPDLPDFDMPDTELPDFDKPEADQPANPEQPDIDAPETPDEDIDTDNNSYAMQVIRLVNKERAKEGLPALTYDADIEKAALVRARETETSFSHTRPDGSAFSTALKENGVSFAAAGENIAWGQKSPEEVMDGWMNSPGHRANIMNKNFTKIGVGYYQNSRGVNYWTQLFTG